MFESARQKAHREPRCPICRAYLNKWGELENQPEKTTTYYYECPKCGYDRKEMKKWKLGQDKQEKQG